MSLRIIRKCKHCGYNFPSNIKECPNCHERDYWTEIARITSDESIKSLPVSVFICIGIIVIAVGALCVVGTYAIHPEIFGEKTQNDSMFLYDRRVNNTSKQKEKANTRNTLLQFSKSIQSDGEEFGRDSGYYIWDGKLYYNLDQRWFSARESGGLDKAKEWYYEEIIPSELVRSAPLSSREYQSHFADEYGVQDILVTGCVGAVRIGSYSPTKIGNSTFHTRNDFSDGYYTNYENGIDGKVLYYNQNSRIFKWSESQRQWIYQPEIEESTFYNLSQLSEQYQPDFADVYGAEDALPYVTPYGVD